MLCSWMCALWDEPSEPSGVTEVTESDGEAGLDSFAACPGYRVPAGCHALVVLGREGLDNREESLRLLS